MNRYPLWKYILVAVALVFGFIYTLPNFYGESPAVQVSSAKVTLKIDEGTRSRVESALQVASITHDGIQLDTVGVKARFRDTDTQLKAKDLLEKTFNPDAADPQFARDRIVKDRRLREVVRSQRHISDHHPSPDSSRLEHNRNINAPRQRKRAPGRIAATPFFGSGAISS